MEAITALGFVALGVIWVGVGIEGTQFWCRRLDNYPPGDLHLALGGFLGPVAWLMPFLFGAG